MTSRISANFALRPPTSGIEELFIKFSYLPTFAIAEPVITVAPS